MSTQSQQTNETAEQDNFLTQNNRIVVPQIPKCFFMKEIFKNRMLPREKDLLDIESYPVALVTVIGSNKRNKRTAYFDWLINFLEYKQISPSITTAACDKFSNVDISSNPPAGIYIWPKKYLLGRNNKTDLVAVLLYTHEGSVQALLNFATVACSNIFVLEDVDKVNNTILQ